MLLQGIPVKLSFIAIASFFVYAMHVLNRLISRNQPALLDLFGKKLTTAMENYIFTPP